MTYLRKNGIPSETPPDGDEVWFSLDGMGTWIPNKGNYLYEIENACLSLHDGLATQIFGSLMTYYSIVTSNPEVVSILVHAGLNSELAISRLDFEKILTAKLSDHSSVNKLLYLYDCRRLVSSIQECSKEVVQIQGEFYKTLNLEPLFYPDIKESDGLRYITSATTTKLHLLLSFVYIRMNSMLDYTTKLVFEVDNLSSNFDNYPKLKSQKVMYGDKSKISINNMVDTIFEPSPLIVEIELFRNLIIHDGLLDDMPKAYKVVLEGKDVEKFVLMPDRSETGYLEKYKNRNRFFSKEDKINLRLTELISDFQITMVSTLNHINQVLLGKQNQEA